MTFDIATDLRVRFFDDATSAWVNLVADSFEVEIERGIDIDQGVFARPKLGQAVVRMAKRSLSDFLTGPNYKSGEALEIAYNNGSTYVILFYGFIQNVSMSYQREPNKLFIEITANDTVAKAMNCLLTSYSISGSIASRSFSNQMAALGSAINAVTPRFTGFAAVGVGASGTTQSLDTLLNFPAGELVNRWLDAELGWFWGDKDNPSCRYMTRTSVNTLQSETWSSSLLTVSNVHSTSVNHVCMDEIDLRYDSDLLVNKVKVTHEVTGATTTQTNSTSVTNDGAQFGSYTVNFDTGAGTLSNLTAWAGEVVSAAQIKQVRGVSVPVVRDDGNVSNIGALDIGQTLQVEFASSGQPTLQVKPIVSSITHRLNADHWEMEIGLWRGM